jgi:heme exporter protein CcmB
MTPFRELLRRELAIAWKDGSSIGVALGFYLIVVTMLPLGLGPDLNLLTRIAPGFAVGGAAAVGSTVTWPLFESDPRTAR